MDDTPTVTYSLGNERIIKCKRPNNKDGKWHDDKEWSDYMTFKSGSIGIINPLDERPAPGDDPTNNVQYLHGGIDESKNKLSMVMTFRVSDFVNIYDNNSRLILDN